MTLSLDQLVRAIPLAWNNETLGNEKHASNHPASGQCVVSSLLIQRHCGGEIIRCEVGGNHQYLRVKHYFNEINGVWVDSTTSQFMLRSPRRLFTRNPPVASYIFNDTWHRVDLLEYRVMDVLDGQV